MAVTHLLLLLAALVSAGCPRDGEVPRNGEPGFDKERISRAVVLLPKARERAGTISFRIHSGPHRGLHACEALGRGKTSTEPRPGWLKGLIGATTIYYAPQTEDGGATIPGLYELRNIRPSEYRIRLLNKDLAGEEALVARLKSHGRPKAFSGVWKTWYPRDPRYAAVAPVDMIWSRRYQSCSQGKDLPVYERPGVVKDPEQLAANPDYYAGPLGKFGTAIHTDRWDDPQTAADPALAGRPERASFLFRDTHGCVKVRPACLALLNVFVDEQRAKGRVVLADVRETP